MTRDDNVATAGRGRAARSPLGLALAATCGAPASTNPVFRPVHTYHLGVWFDSVEAARRAGCPTAQAPLNGDHTTGVRVLNTGTFPDGRGPLARIG